MAKILDGKAVQKKKEGELIKEILEMSPKPHLAIVQVGEFAESSAYIRQKKKFGEKIDAMVSHIKLPADISEDKLIREVNKLNKDTSVHGIIVQIPIPEHLNLSNVIEAIDPRKDVDGLTSYNLKLLWSKEDEGHVPATARGILSLLEFYGIGVSRKKVTVVGRSNLVGKPTALLFINNDATVTICHSQTIDLPAKTREADILIVAVGSPKFVGKEYVSPGQVVIDVGINPVKKDPKDKEAVIKSGLKLQEEIPLYSLVGDVDFEEVKGVVEAISPVPGGVGPMTVVSLFENLLDAYKIQEKMTYHSV